MTTTSDTSQQHVYRPQDYTQDQVNAGQRKINYAITQADKKLVDVLNIMKEAIQLPHGQRQTQKYDEKICTAIDAAIKAINHVASIRPPGCDETWTPPPPPPPPTESAS